MSAQWDAVRAYWLKEAKKNGGQLTCALCNRIVYVDRHYWPQPESLDVDHIIPKAVGGQDTIRNTQPAHRACNQAKGKDPYSHAILKTSRDWSKPSI